jgi:hypothetical protein
VTILVDLDFGEGGYCSGGGVGWWEEGGFCFWGEIVFGDVEGGGGC